MDRETHEELSRLLDGDLPESRAAELRARIATDEELARAWRSMQSMGAALDGLPLESPPAELNRRVIDGEEPHRPSPREGEGGARSVRGSIVLRWLPAAAAAALVLFVLWPSPPPELILTRGSQVVDGQIMVLAADVPVRVDGMARITVEPARSTERVPPQEDTMLDRNTILAAVAGAAVTVAVYEGSALLDTGGENPEILTAGETRTVGSPERGAGLLGRRSEARAATRSPGEGTALTEKIARLEEELDQLRMEATLARGQLGHYEGTPQPWPDDVPAAFQPEGMESALEKVLAESKDLELMEFDCEEFPCVAVIRSHAEGSDWIEGIRGQLEDTDALGFGDGAGISIWASNSSTDEGDVRLVGYAATPPDAMDEDIQARTSFRASQLLKDSTDGILEQGLEP